MSAGLGVRLDRDRLSLYLGDTCELHELEARCRLVGEPDRSDISQAKWRRRGDRFVAECGPLEVTLDVLVSGRSLRLRVSARARAKACVETVGVTARPLLARGAAARLVHSGHQSWDPAGVWEPGQTRTAPDSWWLCGLAAEDGPAIAVAAGSARRLATRFEWRDGVLAMVHCAPPGLAHAQPAWAAARDGRLAGPWLTVAARPDLSAALLAAAGGRRRRQAAPRGWLSWYHHGPWVTRADVAASATAIRAEPYAQLDGNVIQVDDGWQMAYGDWTPNTKFAPLDELSAEIRARGQVAGLWTAPFLISAGADLSHEAPEEWFLRDADTGGRAIDPRHLVMGPMHVLDARRRDVRDHLECVFRRLRQDGFRYFKIDFLYAGAYAGLPALRAGVAAIRRGIGPEAYLLACGAPLLAVRDLVDGCRIGPDTCTPVYNPDLEASEPTFFGDEVQAVARAVAVRSHLQGWFGLDPDVAMAGGLDAGRARQLLTLVALCGGLHFLGDALAALEPWRRELVANPEIGLLSSAGPARADLASGEGSQPPRVWRRKDGLVAVFNWSRDPARHDMAVGARSRVRDLWARADLDPAGGILRLEIPPQDVRVVRLGGGRL